MNVGNVYTCKWVFTLGKVNKCYTMKSFSARDNPLIMSQNSVFFFNLCTYVTGCHTTVISPPPVAMSHFLKILFWNSFYARKVIYAGCDSALESHRVDGERIAFP